MTTTRAIIRRVRADAPTNDLNPTLSNIATMLAGGLTWTNMSAQVVERDFTMPVSLIPPTLAGLWLALTPTLGIVKGADGRVGLSGQVTGGTYGTTPLFTLPQAYWPARQAKLTTSQSSVFTGPSLVVVNTDGTVVAPIVPGVQSGVSTWLSLDQVVFPALDPTAVLPGAPFPLVVVPQGLQGVPRSVLVLSCLDTTNTPVPVAPPLLNWDVAQQGGRQVFRVLNAVGCHPGRSYRVRFVVLAF